ncbi:hypothetical protein ACQEU6_01915 [Spirillospora sp. CA-108201]
MELVDGVGLLRPDEQVFAAMLDGRRNQQLARKPAFGTIEGRERTARAFADHVNAFPWEWTPAMVDEWLGDLRSVRGLKHTTVRGYQGVVRSFCGFITDPACGWAVECETRFGTHPIQVVHEWNTAVHVQDDESDPAKRAFTHNELQTFFDYADEQGLPDPGPGAQGLGAGVPGRDLVQGRLRVRAAPQRDPDAG